MSTSILELDPQVIPLVRGESILDLGCGFGHWGHLLVTHYREYGKGLNWRPRVTGVDIHPGNVEFCRHSGTYEEVHEQDVVGFVGEQGENSFDTVLLVDLVEHLNRQSGDELLREAERVASRAVILSTPNGLGLRGGMDGMTGYNEWEHHLCEWSYKELKNRGYSVRGVRHKLGSRINRTRGLYRLFKTLPILYELLEVVARRHLKIAHTILAWKHFDAEEDSGDE